MCESSHDGKRRRRGGEGEEERASERTGKGRVLQNQTYKQMKVCVWGVGGWG
jgi:hypothetical protein